MNAAQDECWRAAADCHLAPKLWAHSKQATAGGIWTEHAGTVGGREIIYGDFILSWKYCVIFMLNISYNNHEVNLAEDMIKSLLFSRVILSYMIPPIID